MTEKYIETDYGNVYYWISDQWDRARNTIFFFHGLTADHTMFKDQVDFFSEQFNVIVWDAPCHGKSRPFTRFDFELTSEIVHQILLENNVEQIIAVGQSLGGYYIQAFAVRYPEALQAFIGIGTTPYGESYYSESDKFWLKQVEWMGMLYPLNPLKKAAAKQATVTEKGYINMMEMIAPYGKREYCHLMQIAYDAFLQDNRDIKLKCPVLITRGEFDKIGKVNQYCKMWHEKSGYPLVVIVNAGHNANVDNPAETNKVISNFLENTK